jgi:hypothetical protein
MEKSFSFSAVTDRSAPLLRNSSSALNAADLGFDRPKLAGGEVSGDSVSSYGFLYSLRIDW